MNRTLRSALFGLALAAPVAAQTRNGGGISGGTLAGVTADYVRQHWGPPDSLHLAAAILWRGTGDWSVITPATSRAVRAVMDSARESAQRRGVVVGGTISATANALVEYDDKTATVTVLNQSYTVPQRDSVLVLMVDRVDHVGGEPIVATVTIACGADPEFLDARNPAASVMPAMHAATQHWQSCLLHDPRVAAFGGRRPSR